MRSLVRARWALLLILVALAGCASVRRASPEVVTGLSLDELGATFVATGELMNRLRQENVITEREYEPWRDYALRFKAAYGAAVGAYQAGTSDVEAVAKVLAMKTALFRFLITATQKKGGGT